MPTGAEDIAAARAALAIAQLADKQGWFDELRDIFKIKHKVLTLGSTGTGKSNFIDSLQTLVPKAVDRLERTAYAGPDRVWLSDAIFDFIDTPGQDGHRARRLEAIIEMLSEASFGLINVVSYGYHEYATGENQAIIDNSRPSPTWLEDHRAIEIMRPLNGCH